MRVGDRDGGQEGAPTHSFGLEETVEGLQAHPAEPFTRPVCAHAFQDGYAWHTNCPLCLEQVRHMLQVVQDDN